jgi:hypothetical protein
MFESSLALMATAPGTVPTLTQGQVKFRSPPAVTRNLRGGKTQPAADPNPRPSPSRCTTSRVTASITATVWSPASAPEASTGQPDTALKAGHGRGTFKENGAPPPPPPPPAHTFERGIARLYVHACEVQLHGGARAHVCCVAGGQRRFLG